jgi:hypothetical protein
MNECSVPNTGHIHPPIFPPARPVTARLLPIPACVRCPMVTNELIPARSPPILLFVSGSTAWDDLVGLSKILWRDKWSGVLLFFSFPSVSYHFC